MGFEKKESHEIFDCSGILKALLIPPSLFEEKKQFLLVELPFVKEMKLFPKPSLKSCTISLIVFFL